MRSEAVDKIIIEAIVVEYRSPERTINCIRSLLQSDVDIVHVVDNSDDQHNTYNIISNHFSSEERVKIIDSGGNRGFAAGVNIGMSECKGPFTLLINNDATLEPGAVHAMLTKLIENRIALIAFPSLIHAGEILKRVFYHPWLAILTAKKIPGSYEVPRGCCMLIATERFKETLFDERFFMYGEELQLGWRLREKQGTLIWAPSAVVVHEGSASSVRGSRFYEERTALGHILLTEDIVSESICPTLKAFVRSSSILLRATARALRQGSLVPLRALAAARRHATRREDYLSPPM